MGEDETFLVTARDGAVLPVYCWRGPARAPALLVAHANSFAAGSYAPWLALPARDLALFAFAARGAWPLDPDTPDRRWVSAALPEMMARIAGARLTTLGGTGHMMIFETPLTCRGLVLDEIARHA